jgi:hypothetical protein
MASTPPHQGTAKAAPKAPPRMLAMTAVVIFAVAVALAAVLALR